MSDIVEKVQTLRNNKTEQHITNAFHEIYFWSDHTWNYSQTKWLGIPMFQCPLDQWVLQEILHETAPDFVIEIGSAFGGTALFMVSCFGGRVISIDPQDKMKPIPIHPRIEFLKGYSRDIKIIEYVQERTRGKRVMLYQDGEHTADGVYSDLSVYGPMVSLGCYAVVHDTNLKERPITMNPGDENYEMDPYAGVLRFLREAEGFVQDHSREKFYLTFSPGGWLKRVYAPNASSPEPTEAPVVEEPAAAEGV